MPEDNKLYGPDTEEELDDLRDWLFLHVADMYGEVIDMQQAADMLEEYITKRMWKTHTYRTAEGKRDFTLRLKGGAL